MKNKFLLFSTLASCFVLYSLCMTSALYGQQVGPNDPGSGDPIQNLTQVEVDNALTEDGIYTPFISDLPVNDGAPDFRGLHAHPPL
jgi:hypothetical protein